MKALFGRRKGMLSEVESTAKVRVSMTWFGWVLVGCTHLIIGCTGDTAELAASLDSGTMSHDSFPSADSDLDDVMVSHFLDSAVPDSVDSGEVMPVDAGTQPALRVLGLPIIHVMVNDASLSALNADDGTMSEVISTVTMDGRTYEDVRLTLHGGYARTVPKKSYRLTFPDEDKPWVTFFSEDVEEHRRLVLQACWNDGTYLRNKFTHDLVNSLGGWAPRSRHAILSFNGQVYGLFSVIERMDRLLLRRHGLNPDGNVFKAVNHSADWRSKSNPMAGYELKVNQENPVDDLGPFLRALSSTETEYAAYQERVEPILDIDGWMTWQIAQSYAMNQDTFTKNYYLYHDREALSGTTEARFRVFSWDSDATWGNNWDGEVLDPTDQSWHGLDAFAPRILSIPDYRNRYIERFQAGLRGPLHVESLQSELRRSAELIRDAAVMDAELWERPFDFEGEVTRLEDALIERHRVMSTVLEEQRR